MGVHHREMDEVERGGVVEELVKDGRSDHDECD